MRIDIYNSEYKDTWDEFVRNSKNGTFLHYRDFIEYHGNRFNDHSLMFYIGNKLVALLPGHIANKTYYSHQGLTYGGLIMSPKITTSNVLTIFEYLTVTLRHQGIKRIVYKAIPHIYHKSPSEEDLYALFRHKAILTERSVSSTMLLSHKPEYSRSRLNGIKKATKNHIKIQASEDLASFWDILNTNLNEKYDKNPVHSLLEIRYLKEKFPDNIHLIVAFDTEGQMAGGCLVFEMQNIVHAQYTAATHEGKSCGVVDALIDYIIKSYSHKTYFDYGTSTEDSGMYLNKNLIYHKEGFGARAIVYDTYSIDL